MNAGSNSMSQPESIPANGNGGLSKDQNAQAEALSAMITGKTVNPFDPSQNKNYGPRLSFQTPAIDEKKEKQPLKLPFQTAAEIALETPEAVQWLSKPYVVIGAITELDGKIKLGGKSTFTTHMCRAILDGLSFMGEATMKSPILYLTEQPASSWRISLQRAGLLGRDDFHCLYLNRIRGISWQVVADESVAYCKKIGAKLLVIDTLSPFAGVAGDGE